MAQVLKASQFLHARKGIPGHSRVAFVPTMGGLHEGHASLIRHARKLGDVVVASIFVNPTQFAPHEDFSRYPRTFEADAALLRKEKCDILLTPTVEEMYPSSARTWVQVEGMEETIEGKARPGFFRGVATVVAKLFNIVRPDVAVFGQKDAMQCVCVRRLVRELNFPSSIAVAPTAREANGLAMSTRNQYLTAEQRAASGCLYRALQATKAAFDRGARSRTLLEEAFRQTLAQEPSAAFEYLSVADANSGHELEQLSDEGAIVSCAAKVGTTRLIDNILLGKAQRSFLG